MSMAIGGINSINSMMDQSTNAESTQRTDSLKNSVSNLSSTSTEEELKEVLKDFESYFVEQVIKQVKETFIEDEDKDQSNAQVLGKHHVETCQQSQVNCYGKYRNG